jgi:hypothetical protein
MIIQSYRLSSIGGYPIKFRIPLKVVKLLNMCINKIHSKGCIGKYLSGAYQIHDGLQQGNSLLPLLFNFRLEYDIRMV